MLYCKFPKSLNRFDRSPVIQPGDSTPAENDSFDLSEVKLRAGFKKIKGVRLNSVTIDKSLLTV